MKLKQPVTIVMPCSLLDWGMTHWHMCTPTKPFALKTKYLTMHPKKKAFNFPYYQLARVGSFCMKAGKLSKNLCLHSF